MIGLKLLHAGDVERKSLDQIRAKIEATRAEIADTRDAPLPLAEAKARVIEGVTPHVSFMRDKMRAFTVPESEPLYPSEVPAALRHPVTATLVAEALFRPKTFEENVAALLAASSGKAGLPAAARQRRIAELHVKIEQLEIDEETEIVRLEDADCCVERRLDVPIERLFKAWDPRSIVA